MSKIYILATDDEAISRLILEAMLSDDFEVHCVKNGLECLESAKAKKPDLILMDVCMPKLNGIDACKQIKALDGYANLPIIMTSAAAHKSDIKKGLNAGADAYITKPFIGIDLAAIVKHYLSASSLSGK